jgi:hypothetical protein
MRLYVNGSQQVQSSASFGTVDSDYHMGVGYRDGGSIETSYTDANIDEVRVYRRSLSASEISDLYHNGIPFSGSYKKEVNNQENQE